MRTTTKSCVIILIKCAVLFINETFSYFVCCKKTPTIIFSHFICYKSIHPLCDIPMHIKDACILLYWVWSKQTYCASSMQRSTKPCLNSSYIFDHKHNNLYGSCLHSLFWYKNWDMLHPIHGVSYYTYTAQIHFLVLFT